MRAFVVIIKGSDRVPLLDFGIPLVSHIVQRRPALAFNLGKIVGPDQVAELHADTALQVMLARQQQRIRPDLRITPD